jgi:hypothetical protein
MFQRQHVADVPLIVKIDGHHGPLSKWPDFGGEIRIFRRITLLGIHISYITMLTCHEIFPWILHEVPWNPLKSHEQWSTHVKPTCLMAKLLQWIRAFHGFPPSVNSDVSNSSQVLEVWPSSSTCATGTGTWDSRQQNAGGGPENGWGPSNRPIRSIEWENMEKWGLTREFGVPIGTYLQTNIYIYIL